MTASLKLETKNYQIFDMGYGVILLDKSVLTTDTEKVFNNVFMQGDDATSFLKEVDTVLSKNIKDEFIDHWLSGYSDVMDIMEEKALNKIGVFVSEKTKERKLK